MSVASENRKSGKQTNVGKRRVTKKDASTNANKEVGNYEKHPFFVKKANDVKEFLKKVGLPPGIKAS